MEAIKETFPNTNHRLCEWHLNRNRKKNIAYLKKSRLNEDYENVYEIF